MRTLATLLAAALVAAPALAQDLVVQGDVVHTMAGATILDGVVVVRDGKVAAVGPASEVTLPEGVPVRRAAVVTPGFVDAHTTVGLTGLYNVDHDQDQFDDSDPVQPELRAVDSYNAREGLIAWVRSFGVTTVHTGHAPGAVVSGQTMIAKTSGDTVADAVLVPEAMVACTLGDDARARGDAKKPGTRSAAVALLRQALVDARTYRDGRARDDAGKRPARDLRKEALARVLDGELPLLITAHRHHDIAAALRIAEEFGVRVVLDGAAEAPLLADELLAAGVPVIVHPAMMRTSPPPGSTANASFETAALLDRAGVPIAQQSGFEGYVPKVRVLPLEAAIAGRYGLAREPNLASITIGAARILGVDDRVGSLEPGKDGDLALFDGDPFEYTTHCVGTVIDGVVVNEEVR